MNIISIAIQNNINNNNTKRFLSTCRRGSLFICFDFAQVASDTSVARSIGGGGGGAAPTLLLCAGGGGGGN